MKQLIGKTINFVKRSLQPNSLININLSMTDSLKNEFKTRAEFQTDSNGILFITPEKMRAELALCQTSPSRAFIFTELNSYTINLKSEEFDDCIEISTGIGDTIVQEKWRGENGTVGNLYYPVDKKSKQAIIHIQGSVELCQDHRSIALANEGFTVLELMYNAPQHGMGTFYSEKYFDITYVRNAIRQVLLHHSTSAEKVILMGHSKGGDLSIGAGSLFPEMVHGVIVSGSHLYGPVIVGTKFRSHKWEPIGMNTPESRLYGGKNDMFNCLNEQGRPAITRNTNNEWIIDYKVLSTMKEKRGFPLERIGFLEVFAGLDDPCTAPNPEITREYTEFFKSGHDNINVRYFSYGHLTTLPDSPVIASSMMKYDNDKFVTKWSRNSETSDKIKEANEIYRAKNEILSILG